MLFLNPMPIKKLHSVILTILFAKVNGGGPDLWIPYVLSLQFPMGNDKRIGGLPSDITHRLAGLPRQAGKAIHGAWWTRFVLSETRQTHDMQQGTNSASIIHLTTSRCFCFNLMPKFEYCLFAKMSQKVSISKFKGRI